MERKRVYETWNISSNLIKGKVMELNNLIDLIYKGFSTHRLAGHFGVSQTTIMYWLKKHNLKTNPVRGPRTQKQTDLTKKKRLENFLTKYDWGEISTSYDHGMSYMMLIDEYNLNANILCKASKLGLIKPRTALDSRKLSNSINPYKVSKETAGKISRSLKKAHLEGRHPGWKHINENKKRRSYPESYILKILIDKNILDKFLVVEKFPVGKYYLDFAILNLKIDLEIDGIQHIRTQESIDYDSIRNSYLISKGWSVYRILWRNFLSNKKEEIKNLLEYIDNKDRETLVKYDVNEVIKQRNSYCECGNQKHRQSNKCKDCDDASKLVARKFKIEKNSLCELVKTHSFEGIGRIYGVSGNAVKKRCIKLGIDILHQDTLS